MFHLKNNRERRSRLGEALWLRWDDVDLVQGHVIIPIDPSNRRRTSERRAGCWGALAAAANLNA